MSTFREYQADPTTTEPGRPTDAARSRYVSEQRACWDVIASRRGPDSRRGGGRGWIARFLQHLVPPGKRILDVGCGCGDMLAALEPAAGAGVGVDFSTEMIALARRRHPALYFIHLDAAELDLDAAEVELDEPFDFIIMSHVLEGLWDPLEVLRRLPRLSGPRTRLIVITASPLWGAFRTLARRDPAAPVPHQGCLARRDVTRLLDLAGFEVVRHRREVLLPARLPVLSELANRYLARLWPFSLMTANHVSVARPVRPRGGATGAEPPLVSVIVPARNEAGTISAVFERTPEMGAGTELVFVEGGSSDDTYGAIERAMAKHPRRNVKLLLQEGKGKGDAVRMGFSHAAGEVLMILDADLAVAPEDLPKFLEVLTSGKADFINGSRLVLPMEPKAMRPLNYLGNRLFGLGFSWVLGQPLKDTLCGTKVLWRSDYVEIAANRSYFGDFDPFGDFDLLLGASRVHMKIVDLPIRYRDRVYGTTNIDRWRHGLLLLRMFAFATSKILFVGTSRDHGG